MEIVPFEIAKKLKEKWFNEVCYNYYEPLKRCLNQIKTPWTNKESESYGVITAPTISQVLKWLREKKKIHICIDIWKKHINDTSFNWGYDIVNLITTRVVGCDTSCANTYELAAIAGIKYCLDNLI